MNKFHTIYREPFSLGTPLILEKVPGQSLAEIAASVHKLPPDFFTGGCIAVNGELVPRECWMQVRPKANTVVTLHAPIAGGGGSGKQVFGLIAAIALSVATAGIAAGALAPVLGGLGVGTFAAGSLSAALLAGAVGIGGALIIGALTSPPVVRPTEEATGGNRLEAAAVSGNLLEPNTPIPRVVGVRRTYPPFLTEPIVELIGQDEVVEAVYGLAGPHTIEDVRLGDGSVDIGVEDIADVDLEIREGAPGDDLLTFTTRQGRTLEANLEMSTHQVNPINLGQLDDTIPNPLPVFHALTTRVAPDENWIHLNLSGLSLQDSPSANLRVAFRIRMRRRGDTAWRDLPELQYMNATISQVRLQIKILWGSAFTDIFPAAPDTVGWVAAYKVVPAQNVSPAGEVFNADSYFSAGAGDDLYENGTETTTNVRNVVLFGQRVEVYLDTAEWEPGIYDIEIKRSTVFRDSDFTPSTYTYSGNILDFFGRRDSGALPVSRDGLLDAIQIRRMVNVWNEYPIYQSNLTLIALKARNRSVQRLSCLAAGKVLDTRWGRGPLFQADSAARTLWSWDDVGQVADVEVLTLLRTVAVEDPEVPESIKVCVRGSSSGPGTEEGYILGLSSSGDGATDRLQLGEIVSGSLANISAAQFLWDMDRNVFLRLRVNGSMLKAKAWPASLPEPSDWLIEVSNSSVSSAGYAGIYFDSSEDQAYCNWFSVGLNGDAAAFPPSLTDPLSTDFSEYALGSDPSDWTNQFVGGSTAEVTESENLPYNGEASDWTVLRTTSNPAPHFREVLTGSLNFDPLPLELFDDAGIRAWRRRCAEADFTCDMVVEGLEIADLLRVVASTGYARLYRSEIWGVTEDRSRRLESPVQIFSPRNSHSFSWQKAFARLPAGFRINFREEDFDYEGGQVVVYRSNSEGSGQRLEQLTYDGMVDKNKVIQRAKFDLRQASDRATFYSLTAPAEALVCRRGSLIGVNHDVLSRQYGFARIVAVESSEGLITGLRLDSVIEVKNELDVLSTPNILDVADMLEVGVQTSVAIRSSNGTVSVHPVSTETQETDELEFETPTPIAAIDQGNLVVIGTRGREYRRMVVSEIVTNMNLETQLICVDEASEIFEDVFGGAL